MNFKALLLCSIPLILLSVVFMASRPPLNQKPISAIAQQSLNIEQSTQKDRVDAQHEIETHASHKTSLELSPTIRAVNTSASADQETNSHTITDSDIIEVATAITETPELISTLYDSDEEDWGSDDEYGIRNLFIESDLLNGYVLDNIQCKTTFCKVDLSFSEEKSTTQAIEHLSNSIINKYNNLEIHFPHIQNQNSLTAYIGRSVHLPQQ